MKTFMLLSFILLTACNQSLHYDKAVSITADFKPYVDDFVSEGKIVGKTIVIDNLSIHFIPTLEGSVIGECWGRNYGTAGTPSILISKEYWDYANEVERHVLLFHEMGHCVLGRNHVETMQPFGVTSIMYPYLESWTIYSNNWAYYMHELFYGF